MQQHFRMFAAYNKWANSRIYEAASELSADELERNTGAFFKSMMGTLNHLVVADRIWMKRFTGEGDAPTALDAIVHRDFAKLRAARGVEDERIIKWVGSLAAKDFAGRFTYTTVRHAHDLAAAGAGARPFLQPPDPPSRPGAYDPDGARQAQRVARPGAVPADRGRTGVCLSARLHACADGGALLRRLGATAGTTTPRPGHQPSCEIGTMRGAGAQFATVISTIVCDMLRHEGQDDHARTIGNATTSRSNIDPYRRDRDVRAGGLPEQHRRETWLRAAQLLGARLILRTRADRYQTLQPRPGAGANGDAQPSRCRDRSDEALHQRRRHSRRSAATLSRCATVRLTRVGRAWQFRLRPYTRQRPLPSGGCRPLTARHAHHQRPFAPHRRTPAARPCLADLADRHEGRARRPQRHRQDDAVQRHHRRDLPPRPARSACPRTCASARWRRKRRAPRSR